MTVEVSSRLQARTPSTAIVLSKIEGPGAVIRATPTLAIDQATRLGDVYRFVDSTNRHARRDECPEIEARAVWFRSMASRTHSMASS